MARASLALLEAYEDGNNSRKASPALLRMEGSVITLLARTGIIEAKAYVEKAASWLGVQ